MPKWLVFDVENFHDEIEAIGLSYFEDISADEFFDKSFSEFRRDLKGVNSQRQEDLNYSFDVFLLEMLFKLSLVLFNHIFTDQLCTFHPSLIDDDFVVLTQLDLVIFDSFVEILILIAAFLDVVDDLQEIDRNRKYLSSRLQHLLIFLKLHLVLLFKLLLILGLVVRTLQNRL